MEQEQPEKDQKQPESNASSSPEKVAPCPSPVNEQKLPENANAAKPQENGNKADKRADMPQKGKFWTRTWGRVKRDAKLTDWLIVLLTAVLAITSYLQWQEIHSGSTDTHTLAVATKESADTAQRQLELSERPWLKISFTVEPQGASFQNGGFQLSLRAHITNIGHSVATGVIVPSEMFLAPGDSGIFKEPLRRQQRLCDTAASEPIGPPHGPDIRLVIFPGDSDESLTLGHGFSKNEIDSTKTLIPQLSGKRIVPIMVGCVDYQYATSTRHHQTQFIYEVQRFDRTAASNHLYPIASIEVDHSIPAPDVVLIKYAFGGFLAD